MILFWRMKSNIAITPLSSYTEEPLYKIMLKGIVSGVLFSFLILLCELHSILSHLAVSSFSSVTFYISSFCFF